MTLTITLTRAEEAALLEEVKRHVPAAKLISTLHVADGHLKAEVGPVQVRFDLKVESG